jgi:hypothetical protein
MKSTLRHDGGSGLRSGEIAMASDSDGDSDEQSSDQPEPGMYSTGHLDGTAHFVHQARDENDIEGWPAEVAHPVVTQCSFEKDGAVRIDDGEVAADTLASLCAHCARGVEEDDLAAVLDLARDFLAEEFDLGDYDEPMASRVDEAETDEET